MNMVGSRRMISGPVVLHEYACLALSPSQAPSLGVWLVRGRGRGSIESVGEDSLVDGLLTGLPISI